MKIKKLIAIFMGTLSLSVLTAVSVPSGNLNVLAAAEKTATEAEQKAEETQKTETEKKTEEAQKTETEQKTEEAQKTETEQKTEEAQKTETEQKAEETQKPETEQKTEETQKTETEQKTEEEQKTETEQTKEDARKALQNDPEHVHNFKWIAKMNESESAEGTLNYICEECGKVWYFRPVSPYFAFQGSLAHRIEKAAEGETVKAKTSLFISFDKQVMKALSDRPDVSLYVSFLDGEYKGNRVSFVIPAGEDTMSLLDENGYAGFLYLGGKYGLTMEEPANPDSASAEEKDTKASEDKTAEKDTKAAENKAEENASEASDNKSEESPAEVNAIRGGDDNGRGNTNNNSGKQDEKKESETTDDDNESADNNGKTEKNDG